MTSDEAEIEALGEVPFVEPEAFVPLRYLDVAVALPDQNPVVILEEIAAPHRVLRIAVGPLEGVAIADAARGTLTPKPLTHELFADVLAAFNLTLEVVRITAVEGSAFYAELVLSGPSGARVLACRPSDGIALALRQVPPPPLTATPAVLENVGEGAPDS